MPKSTAKKSYTVKSQVQMGVRNEKVADPLSPGAVDTQILEPGDKVELTEDQANEIRHALFNPPNMPTRRAEDEDEVDEDEEGNFDDVEDAMDSIRSRPDHPDSGVRQDHKVDASTLAAAAKTEEVGGGFERANAGDPAKDKAATDKDKAGK